MAWGQPENFNQPALQASLFFMLLVNTLNEQDCNALLVHGLSGNTPECDFVPWPYTKKLALLLGSNHLMCLSFIDWAETQVWLLRRRFRDGDAKPAIVQSILSCFLHWWYQHYTKGGHGDQEQASEALALLLLIPDCWRWKIFNSSRHCFRAAKRKRVSPVRKFLFLAVLLYQKNLTWENPKDYSARESKKRVKKPMGAPWGHRYARKSFILCFFILKSPSLTVP